jgi:hypothetical protein
MVGISAAWHSRKRAIPKCGNGTGFEQQNCAVRKESAVAASLLGRVQYKLDTWTKRNLS